MIDHITIENFKSLRRVDLSLGRLNLFIGANASGKSNFLDALRVLQGIGNGFTISEILDGKPKSATNATWEGVRGGSSNACFAGAGENASGTVPETVHPGVVTLGAQGRLEGTPTWEFRIALSPEAGRISRECLKTETTSYDSGDHTVDIYRPSGRPSLQVRCDIENLEEALSNEFESTRPVLSQIATGNLQNLISLSTLGWIDSVARQTDLARAVARLLADVQRVTPAPAMLRAYSESSGARRMGDRGENFAAIVQSICKDKQVKDVSLSWLRELRPDEIDDVDVLYGAEKEPLFMLRENGRKFSAKVLSDGTLRFAALAAAFFQPDMPGLVMMEEIENGIHASRLRLLLELLRSQTEEAGTQIIATTHSATVLDWLSEEDYKTTFFCKRDKETGESRIRALTDVPHFMDVIEKRPASELFSEGWLEAAP